MSDASKYRRHPRMKDEVVSDHRNVEVLQKQLARAASDGDEQGVVMVGHALAMLIRFHSQAEMDVMYPAMADMLGAQGAKMQEEALGEHAEVEQLVGQALGADPKSKAFTEALDKAATAFLQHAEDEETRLIPALEQAVGDVKMLSMENQMLSAKMNAPLAPQVP